jgi:hypothetical protein
MTNTITGLTPTFIGPAEEQQPDTYESLVGAVVRALRAGDDAEATRAMDALRPLGRWAR